MFFFPKFYFRKMRKHKKLVPSFFYCFEIILAVINWDSPWRWPPFAVHLWPSLTSLLCAEACSGTQFSPLPPGPLLLLQHLALQRWCYEVTTLLLSLVWTHFLPLVQSVLAELQCKENYWSAKVLSDDLKTMLMTIWDNFIPGLALYSFN